MQMFRSFIFSFETLQVKDLLSRGVCVSLLTALSVVLTGEAISRLAIWPLKDYWKFWNKAAGDKFLWYQEQVKSAGGFDLVIVGDSTAARNFVPDEFEAFCAIKTFNLGWPANFPLAFEWSTIPLLDSPFLAPKVIVLSMSPKAFTSHQRNSEFEEAILNSALARHAKGETLVSDFIFLARLGSARKMSSGWFTGKGLFKEPPENGAMLLDGQETVTVSQIEPGDVFNQGGLSPERMQVLVKLANLAESRGIKLIVVVPPRQIEERIGVEEQFIDQVKSLMTPKGFSVLDLRRMETLESEHFHDAMHLNREGAIVFSRIVAEYVCNENGRLQEQ